MNRQRGSGLSSLSFSGTRKTLFFFFSVLLLILLNEKNLSFFSHVAVGKTLTLPASSSIVAGLDVLSGRKRIRRERKHKR